MLTSNAPCEKLATLHRANELFVRAVERTIFARGGLTEAQVVYLTRRPAEWDRLFHLDPATVTTRRAANVFRRAVSEGRFIVSGYRCGHQVYDLPEGFAG